VKIGKKANSRGRFRHFALRCLEITNFPHAQISAIFKSHLRRHIKNTCTNCTQNSRIFHARFLHFFTIFRRFCNNRATLEHHHLKSGLKTLKGKYTRHFYIQKQLIFKENHTFFMFSIGLT
jgi:hypothetical protein